MLAIVHILSWGYSLSWFITCWGYLSSILHPIYSGNFGPPLWKTWLGSFSTKWTNIASSTEASSIFPKLQSIGNHFLSILSDPLACFDRLKCYVCLWRHSVNARNLRPRDLGSIFCWMNAISHKYRITCGIHQQLLSLYRITANVPFKCTTIIHLVFYRGKKPLEGPSFSAIRKSVQKIHEEYRSGS